MIKKIMYPSPAVFWSKDVILPPTNKRVANMVRSTSNQGLHSLVILIRGRIVYLAPVFLADFNSNLFIITRFNS